VAGTLGALGALALPYLLPALLIGGLAGLVRGLSGFGAALVMVPLLLLVAPPAVVVPAAVISTLLGSLSQVPGAWRDADRRMAGGLVAAALAALPLGTWLLLAVPAGTLKAGIGAFVILSSLALAAARSWHVRPTVARTLGAGLLGGLASGAVGLPGPPVVLYLLGCRLPARAARGTLIVFFAMLGMAQLVGLLAAGLVDARVLALALSLTPGILAFGWAGQRLFRMTGDRHYRLVAVLILLATGVTALLDSGG
jgi:uncharacterized protein